MKLAIALVVATGLVALGAAAYVVLWNRDPAPNDVAACVRRAGLPIVRSNTALGVARADAAVGALRAVRRWDFGRTEGVLLAPADRAYAVLVLSNPDAPSLRGDASRRVYSGPGSFPLVAVEKPVRGRLLRCADAVEG